MKLFKNLVDVGEKREDCCVSTDSLQVPAVRCASL